MIVPVNCKWLMSCNAHYRVAFFGVQGCAVVVEANQLEYGQRAHVSVSSARSGCFLQPEVMEVTQLAFVLDSSPWHVCPACLRTTLYCRNQKQPDLN